jgi:small subunit ribosomal protein S1
LSAAGFAGNHSNYHHLMSEEKKDLNPSEESVDKTPEEINQAKEQAAGEAAAEQKESTEPAEKEEAAETPVEETAETPAEETAETPVEETAETPVEETAETPAEEAAETPAEEAVQDTAETSESAPEEEKKAEDVAEETATDEAVVETPATEELAAVNIAETESATTKEVFVDEPQAASIVKKEEKEKKEEDQFAAQVPGEFDWESVGKRQDSYSDAERKRLEVLYDETLKSIGEGEVIDGTVVSINNREVVVNIGFKSDGVIPAAEIRYNPNLKPGDSIEVYVESQEDLSGQLVLSHKKARILRSWERINQSMDNDEIITGFVKCRTKGGLIVDVFGIEAFLPGSQIDVKPIRDYDIYVGKTMEFKVVKINHEYKNVVVSHKALIEAELEVQKAEIIAKLEKGQILEGTVKNITSYGVFVDLGGVDGLVHITDLSWGRINHPEEIVSLDEKIKVVILDFDENKKRIALGLKQLTAHPWDSLNPDLKIGDKVKGKVVVIADYGAFIEIAPGVEGLIHVSEMSWSQHLRTAQDFLKVGDEIEAVILTLDREDRKMSLGIKQLIPDPWENIHEKYPINSRHQATVRNFTNFGIFVELEEGVDGLIHISDLSWSKKIKHPAEFTKIGEAIEVVVLDVDKENRRLSLGHKQLEENPWDVFESVFTIDSVHQGTIVGTSDKGVIVALPYGVEGFAPTRHVVKEDGATARMDDSLDFKVIEFNKESKKIVVSHTKTFQDVKSAERATETSERKAREKTGTKVVKKLKETMEKTTLGDLGVLAELKSEIEKTEKTERAAKLEKLEKQQAAKVVKKEEEKAPEAAAEKVDEEAEAPGAEKKEKKATAPVKEKKAAAPAKADSEKKKKTAKKAEEKSEVKEEEEAKADDKEEKKEE